MRKVAESCSDEDLVVVKSVNKSRCVRVVECEVKGNEVVSEFEFSSFVVCLLTCPSGVEKLGEKLNDLSKTHTEQPAK